MKDDNLKKTFKPVWWKIETKRFKNKNIIYFFWKRFFHFQFFIRFGDKIQAQVAVESSKCAWVCACEHNYICVFVCVWVFVYQRVREKATLFFFLSFDVRNELKIN